MMCRHAHENSNLDSHCPKIQLRNREKFQAVYTTLTRVQNSPFYRGAKLWERLAVGVRKSTSKVKFKAIIT